MVIPAVLDFEASGLGAGSYPIEVGYVLADGRSFCSLIRPESDWLGWSADAEQLHGISRAMLQQHGRPALDVARALNDQLLGLTLYSDAWGNDFTWLSLLFEGAGLVPRFRLQPLHALLDEGQQQRWNAARIEVSAELALGRHRASSDALILQQTFLRTRRDDTQSAGAACPPVRARYSGS